MLESDGEAKRQLTIKRKQLRKLRDEQKCLRYRLFPGHCREPHPHNIKIAVVNVMTFGAQQHRDFQQFLEVSGMLEPEYRSMIFSPLKVYSQAFDHQGQLTYRGRKWSELYDKWLSRVTAIPAEIAVLESEIEHLKAVVKTAKQQA